MPKEEIILASTGSPAIQDDTFNATSRNRFHAVDRIRHHAC
jgi:hypothetical protein